MSPRPPDFTRLFAPGARHDFSRFRAGCVVTVRIEQAATLRLPSGRLTAGQPWVSFPDGAERYAFVQRVAPGDYPVELIMADFNDPGNPQGNVSFCAVAAARVAVRGEPAASWRMALQPGQDDADLAPDAFFGYPVDGGMGSFGSPEARDALARDPDTEAIMDAAEDVIDADDVGIYVDEATGDNIVMFRSGDGDGHYGTWVGYTAGGEIACFVTDFMTLTWDDGGEDGEGRSAAAGPQDSKTAAAVQQPGEPARGRATVRGTPGRGVPATKAVPGVKGVPGVPAGRRVQRSEPKQ